MLQYLAAGIVLGSIIAVTAAGLTLIYGVLKITNFAHGDMVTFGAYMALFFNVGLGLPLWMAFLLAIAAGALLGAATEWVIWRPMRVRGAGTVAIIIASLGLAFFLRNMLVFFFTATTQRYDVPVTSKIALGPLPVRLTPDEIRVVVAAVLIMVALYLLLQFTTIGRAMRALSDNPNLAWVSGVDVDRVVVATWILGGGLAAAGGVLYGLIRPIDTNMGWFLLLPMFAAIILGGIGSAYGAIVGGYILGIFQQLSLMVIPAEYRLAAAFFVLIVVLLFFPRGIFGQKVLA
ncbi:MAG: branched-chain amino acid ABC transporter permease [Clostridiales bacterium]|nr:branched-chain amino acid ABC transporter permease [Clostridiales bacterium]